MHQPRAGPGPAPEVLSQLRLSSLQVAASNDAVLLPLGPRTPSRYRTFRRSSARLTCKTPFPRPCCAAHVHRPLALEPESLPGSPAPQGLEAVPVRHPAHGGGRPDGSRLSLAGRAPGQRSRRSRRDTRPSPGARDDERLSHGGHGHPRAKSLVRRFEEGRTPSLRRHRRAQRALARDPERSPFTYLDEDGEIGERCSRAVPLRRGLPVEPRSSAASTLMRLRGSEARRSPTCGIETSCTTCSSRW